LNPEELALIRKATPNKTYIIEDEYGRNRFRWKLMLIPSGVVDLIVAAIVAYVIHPFLGLPVALFTWLPIRWLLFNQVISNVTVGE
jgi:hypothetical protein